MFVYFLIVDLSMVHYKQQRENSFPVLLYKQVKCTGKEVGN